jgi:hypothetical protein
LRQYSTTNFEAAGHARPMEEKKGADKGSDGQLYMTDRMSQTKTLIISVKGGHG